MAPQESVSGWIGQLREGDDQAAAQLWQRYFQRLVSLARVALRGTPRRVANEEDVALSAFDSFCRGVEQGCFPELRDRDGLWRLLVVLTARKAGHLRRDQARQKRGGGAVLDQADFDQVVSQEPTPAFAVQVKEECERLLQRLDDASLRALAIWKMEGYTNLEIAERLGCCLSTVERRLQLIRKLWAAEGAPTPDNPEAGEGKGSP
jgi:DNA-directed RNA polymerase specialized sigma24 family protein